MQNRTRTLTGLLAMLCLGQPSLVTADTIEKNSMDVAQITQEDAMDLNTITVEQLMTLPGIGKSKAEAIVTYRDEKGYFHEVDQLTEVRGIGDKMLEKLRPHLKVVTH